MKTTTLLLCISMFFCSQVLFAQMQDSSIVKIETSDGNEFFGQIVDEDAEIIILETKSLGKLTISKNDIKSRTLVSPDQIKDGQLWFENPQATRYFWGSNGYGLKKGEGYYQNIWVLWNQFSVGITDNFSIGAGIIPLFLFDGSPTPIFISPKVSIPIQPDKFNIGAGVLAGTVLGDDFTTFGLLYGTTTFGSRDKNISLGLAYGFADGEMANAPLINVSTLIRTTPRMYFISENYILPFDDSSGVILGLGGRWIIKKAALDFMGVIPIAEDMGGFVIIPMLGFSIPF
ncbi:hypothetical protein SLH46_04300 [Draconibacterium sp. IB214405]|uniref:hypothetical protein n=1 Tax=Draconibacterium sp. IB214405 TaxID=3097352 RepID=UPI002A16F851|nr:hypothetical protein [Draconibacterium sp. IB214405]MDX8338393.1 hypothetical protein [Draconibacterium sp. IB214405]